MGRDMHQNNKILEKIVGPKNMRGSPRKSVRGLTIKLLNKTSELETIKEGKPFISLIFRQKEYQKNYVSRIEMFQL